MKNSILLRLSMLAIAATTLGFASRATQAEDPPKSVKLEVADGKLSLDTPEGWKKVETKSTFNLYEFRAPFDAKEDQQVRITVSAAGGGVQPNIDRWKGQFDQVKDADVKVEKKDINGQSVNFIEITGTFKDTMGGPFSGGPTKKLPNYKMLGLIIETKASGLIFVKMTGPQEVVAKQADGWKKMAEGIKAK